MVILLATRISYLVHSKHIAMAGTIFLRILQLVCSLGIIAGLQQIPSLASEIRSVFEGEPWTLARLCGRAVAVTGPITVAVVLIALLELAVRNWKQERRLKAAYPNEPWLWKPQWAAKHMRLSNKPLIIGWLCCFAIYLFGALPLAIASDKKPFMVFAGVVGLVALLILRMIWQSRQWNRAELRISTLPGVIGGPFTGAIILQQTFPPGTIFDVNLKCENLITTRYNNKSETRRIDLWSSTIYIQEPLKGGPAGTTALPINFAIPFEATPTSSNNHDTVRWALSVQKKEDVSTGGASFEIPVYRTADSRSDYEIDDELIQKHLAVIDPASVLRRFGLNEQQLSPDCLRLHFREFDTSIFWTLLVMSVCGIGVLVAMWIWIRDRNTMLFAMAFPGVFELMFLYGIIHMLFWRCRIDQLVTTAVNQPETLAELQVPTKRLRVIEAESGIWGIRKSIRVPADRTTVLRCKIDHRANEKESWSIWLCGADDQKLKLISTFNSSSEAQAAAKYLAQKLGISAPSVKAEDGFLK